jgi:iron complex transport system permease protein
MLPVMLAALVVAALAAMMMGGVSMSADEVLRGLWNTLRGDAGTDAASRILLTARLPRVLLALAVGGAMGMAGLAAQTLFRNPLASPYVMGVSNGAAVGAVVGMLLAGCHGNLSVLEDNGRPQTG